jgi:hypothetical protein
MHDETVLIQPGYEVLARGEAIGEVATVLEHEDGTYIHVRRYGPGEDDLYIPYAAVSKVVSKHLYLDLNPADLLGQSWHTHPRSGPAPA